jgi:hypothetical protein
MLPNAWRSNRDRHINPFAAERNGLGPRGGVGRIKLPARKSQVDYVRAGFRDRLSKRIKICRVRRVKMIAQRIDIMHTELFDDESREFLQVHARNRRVSLTIRRAVNQTPEGPGGDSQTIVRLGRKTGKGE